MNLNEYVEENGTMRILIYGISKTGKSTLAATLAQKYQLHWLDLENASETLVKLPYEVKQNIDLIKIPDRASTPVACNTILNLLKFKKANICKAHGLINCPNCMKAGAVIQAVDFTNLDPKNDIVVLDSLTQLGWSMLAYNLKSQPVDYKPERDDWGALRRYTEYAASEIQGLPFNFIATATPVETVMENNKTKLVPQFGSKDMGQAIMAKFSTIIYTDVVNGKHVAYSSSTASNSFVSGSRAGQAIEMLESPSLLPLFEEFRAGEIKTVKVSKQAPLSSPNIVVPTVQEATGTALNKLSLKIKK